MPGKNNASAAKGKGFNKKNRIADEKNKGILSEMMREGIDENSTRFGRVTKNSGNSRFLVTLSDGRENVSALVSNVLRARQATPIGLGTIVFVTLPNWEKEAQLAKTIGRQVIDIEAYIEAVLDKKAIRHFRDEGSLTAALIDGKDLSSDEAEDGFEFEDAPEPKDSDDEDEEEEGASKKKKWTGQRGKNAVLMPPAGELDIGAI